MKLHLLTVRHSSLSGQEIQQYLFCFSIFTFKFLFMFHQIQNVVRLISIHCGYFIYFLSAMTAHTLTQAITTIAINIPQQYGYVIIVAAILALQILVIGFIFPGQARRKIFTKDFMVKNFGEAHKKEIGREIESRGYPDMGSGLYSQKLGYKQWYNYNNAQRVHYNYLEMAPSTFLCLVLAGVYYPLHAAGFGLGLALFRVIYSVGYVKYGPRGRAIGAFGNDFCLAALIYLTAMTGWKIINGQAP